MTRLRPVGIGAVAVLAVLASPAMAQTVGLRLRHDSTAAPIAGAIVRLIGERGPVAQGLTNELGLLELRAPAPGTYRLRIDRIGWTGLLTDPVTLAAGPALQLTVPMRSARVELPAIEVRGRSRCESRAEQGALAAALWGEVQKALTANLITTRQRLPLHLREFVREVNRDHQPLREWVVVSRLTRGRPFGSLPAAELARSGFVGQAEGDSLTFAAPDADLLLSDEFVATHCFRAVPGEAGLVGLGFEPIPGRRVPEINGTLWADRASSELRFLDYSYTRLPGLLRRAELGGRVEFRRLPTGAWLVSYWHIRMPRLVSQTVYVRGDSQVVAMLTGYLDHGGRADIALDSRGRVDRAILQGRVYDSIAGTGLARALVWVEGAADSLPTDSEGRFALAVQASGDQVVSVRHPRLGLLGEPTSRQVLLSLGDTTMVEFAVPSLAAFARTLCRNRTRSGRVSVMGIAWRVDGTPAVDQEIRVMKRTRRGNVPVNEARPARSTRRGLYGLCNLPSQDTVQVIMSETGITLLELPVALDTGSRWVELREWGSPDTARVAFSAITALADEDADDLVARVGPAVITGRVYDSTTGLGLGGAVVRVRDLPDSAITDSAGGFRLPTDATGAREVAASHPLLGSLQGATSSAVLLSLGDTSLVSFAVIPLRSVVQRLCGDPRGRAGLVGIALGPSGNPEENLAIRVRWRTQNGWREERTESGARGLYAFCDLTPGASLAVRLVDPSGRVAGGSVRLERAEYRWQELRPSRDR